MFDVASDPKDVPKIIEQVAKEPSCESAEKGTVGG